MSDLVEKVARAITPHPDFCIMGSGSVSSNGVTTSECHMRAWEANIGVAQAAIAVVLADEVAKRDTLTNASTLTKNYCLTGSSADAGEIVKRLNEFRHSLPADTFPYNLSAQVKPLLEDAASIIERQADEIEHWRKQNIDTIEEYGQHEQGLKAEIERQAARIKELERECNCPKDHVPGCPAPQADAEEIEAISAYLHEWCKQLGVEHHDCPSCKALRFIERQAAEIDNLAREREEWNGKHQQAQGPLARF